MIFVLFFLIMVGRCLEIRATNISWTDDLDNEILNLYFQTLPADKQRRERMESLWLARNPDYEHQTMEKLLRRARYLMKLKNYEWALKPETERCKLEGYLSRISERIIQPQVNDEEKVYNILLEEHPEYRSKPMLIRTVVHKWYQPRWKGLRVNEVNWTPQLKADLWYIANAVKFGKGIIEKRIGSRWSQMHHDLNIKQSSLKAELKNLENENYKPSPEELAEAKRKYHELFPHEIDGSDEEAVHRRVCDQGRRWSRQRCADLIYIHSQNEHHYGYVRNILEDRWSKLYGEYYPLDGRNLIRQIRRLKAQNFVSNPKEMAKAKRKYESLTPLNISNLERCTKKKQECEKEPEIHTASSNPLDEQHRQEGDILTAQSSTGHGIQQQQHMIADQFFALPHQDFHFTPTDHLHSLIMPEHSVVNYTAHTPNLHESSDFLGGDGFLMDHRLNIPYNQAYSLHDLIAPYHNNKHGGSSSRSKSPRI